MQLMTLFILVFQTPPVSIAEKPGCRYALLVGIETYKNKFPMVPGEADVAMMENLLGPEGYDFDEVHRLVGPQATEEGFIRALQELACRTTSEDVVVIYFSGHGYQVHDWDGDERDERDETLILWDSDLGLVDDEFAEYLNNFRSNHLVVILDACHASGGLRGSRAKSLNGEGNSIEGADPGHSFFVEQPILKQRNWVFLAATSKESMLSWHNTEFSHFTDGLVRVLTRAGSNALTYDLLAIQVHAETKLQGQSVSFHGATNQLVFGTERPFRPVMVVSEKVGSHWPALGPPLPGWNPGGMVRIYDRRQAGEAWRDSTVAKALLSIAAANPGAVWLKPVGENLNIRSGDIAVLSQAGVKSRLKVRVRNDCDGALNDQEEKVLKEAIDRWEGLEELVLFSQDQPDYELWRRSDGRLIVSDSKGGSLVALDTNNEMEQTAWTLWLLAFRRHIHLLEPSLETLSLRLVPVDGGPEFKQSKAGEWLLPSGRGFQIEITHTGQTDQSLAPGVLVISRNGSVISLPYNEIRPVLGPNEKHRFWLPFRVGHTPGAIETIAVFGTRPEDGVAWPPLNFTPREPPEPRGLLLPDLIRQVVPHQRGKMIQVSTPKWVFSRVITRTL